MLPAFLVEAALYLAAGMQSTRERLEELSPSRLALLTTVAAAVPYTICTVGLGVFDWRSAFLILVLAAFASYFYVLLPHRPAIDLVFLACIASVVLLKVFPRLFPAPLPRLELSVLGAAMWVRTTMLVMLSIRKMDGVGFGFLPRARDWGIGLRYYLLFMPVAVALALWLGFVRVQPRPFGLRMVLLTVATFFGILWIVALSEEFFFRGVLQQTLDKLLDSRVAGLIIASLVFGAVHLPFRAFPNWRFAILATLAGVAYGLAFRAAGSIRAAMVAHALVVTTWRLLA